MELSGRCKRARGWSYGIRCVPGSAGVRSQSRGSSSVDLWMANLPRAKARMPSMAVAGLGLQTKNLLLRVDAHLRPVQWGERFRDEWDRDEKCRDAWVQDKWDQTVALCSLIRLQLRL